MTEPWKTLLHISESTKIKLIGFFARVPCVLLALCVIAAIGMAQAWGRGSLSSVGLGAVMLALCGLIGWVRPRLWWLALSLGCLAGYWHVTSLDRQRVLNEGMGDLVELNVLCLDDFHFAGARSRGVVRVLDGEYSGAKLMLSLRGGISTGSGVVERVGREAELAELVLRKGSELRVIGNLSGIAPPRNPGEFHQKEWLERQGVYARLYVEEWSKEGDIWWGALAGWLSQLRVNVEESITAGLEEDEAVLLRAIFLGEKPEMQDGVTEDFRRSGTLHVFAVSGLHVMMVGTVVFVLLRLLQLPQWVQVIGVVVVMWLYAGITGANPPAVRAAFMGSLLIIALLVRRKVVLLNSVCLCMAVLCLVDSYLLFQPGFQLSFGVVLAIVLTHSWWLARFEFIQVKEEYLPRQLYSKTQSAWLKGRVVCANSLAVGFSAWGGSSGLVWWHFGVVSPIALLVGLPMMLLVWMVMCLSCLSVVFGALMPGEATWIAAVNGPLAKTVHSLAAWSARAPGGHFEKRLWEKDQQVVIYDVGRGGEAAYLGIAGGVLLDTGTHSFASSIIVPSIKERGGHLDSLILTHGDAGHSGGALAVLDHFRPRQCLAPDTFSRSPSYQALREHVKESSVHMATCSVGDTLLLDAESWIEILASDATGALADDRALVLRLHWNGSTILFAGDMGFRTLSELCEEGVEMRSDVLVLGAHISDPLDWQVLLREVQPKLILLGQQRERMSPNQRKHLALYKKKAGATVLEQRVRGAVILSQKNGKILYETLLKEDE